MKYVIKQIKSLRGFVLTGSVAAYNNVDEKKYV